ncbi:hypothetical protein N7470_005796 [Penicillium chermesinum]|nr:hypothetical protein N7470_005796 [Penicillium chermesinum]
MNSAGNKDFRDQLGKFRLETNAPAPVSWPQSTSLPSIADAPEPPIPNNASTAAALAASRSKRVSTACDFCRKRKKKCDFRYPNCSACSRAGVRCTIPPPGPQVANSSVPRDQLENLQKRVKWLEEIVRWKTGITVTDMATGTPVDGEGDPDWWYQVPSIIATGSRSAATSMPSPAGSGGSSVTAAGTSEASPARASSAVGSAALHESTGAAARIVGGSRAGLGKYFDSMDFQYPFLSRTEFMGHLRYIHAGGVPTPEVHNMYHIVVAIALLMGSADPNKAADFYHASQETMSAALQNEDLPAVRALLCLALYTMFATSGPSIWHVLGSTLRLAVSMGLHKPKIYSSPTEEEMAKRAFWSLYNLDRLISSTLGRPLGIADEDISVDLPREINEDGTEAPGASAMTIPLQVMRLRRIFSRIYRYLYSNLPRPSPQEVAVTLSQFRRELDEWRMNAPVIPGAILYSTSYFDYLYYTTILLMYRPSERNPTPDTTSIISCGDSSIQVIRSYWDNYSVGKLKWIWLTLSQLYFAGITILWCLEQNARAWREHLTPPWQPDEEMMRRAIQAVVPFSMPTMGTPQASTVPLAPVLDDVLLVDSNATMPMIDPQMAEQLFYSYNWFQEEMASYYTL